MTYCLAEVLAAVHLLWSMYRPDYFSFIHVEVFEITIFREDIYGLLCYMLQAYFSL